MKKQWIKKLAVVGLTSVMLLSTSIYARGPQKKLNKQTGTVWMTELNLNTQQMAKINELKDAMQPAMMDIRHQIRKTELEIKKLNRKDLADQKQITVLRKSVFDHETAIQSLQNTHHKQIRVLLTADQQIMFDERGYGQGRSGDNGRTKRGAGREGQGSNSNGRSGNYNRG